MALTVAATSTPAVPDAWHVRPLTGALGAEVHGITLADLDDAGFDALYRLWLEHLVLFFPGQRLTAAEHIAFASRFGEIEVHPYLAKHDDHEEIVVLAGESRADMWHTDVTFQDRPALASILNMVRCPSVGGDTCWTNQYLAYDRLSAHMQALLDNLSAIHDARDYGHLEVRAEHPVVRVHPVTGRRSLFVNRLFTRSIEQLGKVESDAVLRMLFDWSEQPNFQVRYRWEEGTVAVWDNRCTQHFAVNDYAGGRRIERVTIVGDVPIGPRLTGSEAGQ